MNSAWNLPPVAVSSLPQLPSLPSLPPNMDKKKLAQVLRGDQGQTPNIIINLDLAELAQAIRELPERQADVHQKVDGLTPSVTG